MNYADPQPTPMVSSDPLPAGTPMGTSTPRYAVLPITEHPPYPHSCDLCGGRGITGDRYEMQGDSFILLVDVICPLCGGCGNNQYHEGCPPDAHADLDEYLNDVGEDDAGMEMACPSCLTGRGWNAVQGFGGPGEAGGDIEMVMLRVPCGCATDRLVYGNTPADL